MHKQPNDQAGHGERLCNAECCFIVVGKLDSNLNILLLATECQSECIRGSFNRFSTADLNAVITDAKLRQFQLSGQVLIHSNVQRNV